MIIEIIADSVTDAITIEKAGASRIELVSAMSEGGLTPSYGLIEEVCRQVEIPVNVMIRPHSRSFCYSEQDLQVMERDIRVCRKLGATGVVFGALTADKQIDEGHVTRLLKAAEGLDVTFHRAFDEASDLVAALHKLKQYPQISRILTSGGQAKAVEAIEQFQQLTPLVDSSGLQLLAGAGLTPENIEAFLEEVAVSEVHFGSAVRIDASFGCTVDFSKLKRLVEQLAN